MSIRSRAPRAKAFSIGVVERGASGVKKKSGKEKIRNVNPAIGATMRSLACSCAPMPNNGALGTHHQSTLPGKVKAQATKLSAASEKALPSESASAEARCVFAIPAARTSKELCNTSLHGNKTAMKAPERSARPKDQLAPGGVNQSAMVEADIIKTTKASQILRWPNRSIAAPRSGAVAITATLAQVCQREMISCPLIGSPTSVAAT